MAPLPLVMLTVPLSPGATPSVCVPLKFKSRPPMLIVPLASVRPVPATSTIPTGHIQRPCERDGFQRGFEPAAPETVTVVPVCTVAPASVPPDNVTPLLSLNAPVTVSVPPDNAMGSEALTLATLSVALVECVMVTLPGTSITASSSGPGKTPPCQLDAVSQSPPAGFIQLIIAGASRASSASNHGRCRWRRTDYADYGVGSPWPTVRATVAGD